MIGPGSYYEVYMCLIVLVLPGDPKIDPLTIEAFIPKPLS